MSANGLFDEGLRLLSAGYSIAPIFDYSKWPSEGWKACQDELMSVAAFRSLCQSNGNKPLTGLVLVIGEATWQRHHYLWVLDIEKEHRQIAEPWLDKNIPGWLDGCVVETGDAGLHLYLTSPMPVKKVDYAWGEVRGKNHIAVVPPSIHPVTRKPYRWLNGGLV